jgi:hypothetical protein
MNMTVVEEPTPSPSSSGSGEPTFVPSIGRYSYYYAFHLLNES